MLALELDGATLGRCHLIDGTASPLTIADRAGGRSIVVVGVSRAVLGPTVRVVAPPGELGEQELVRGLWPSMTGTLDPQAMAWAVAVLTGRPVKLALVPPGGDCRRSLLSFLENLCSEPG